MNLEQSIKFLRTHGFSVALRRDNTGTYEHWAPWRYVVRAKLTGTETRQLDSRAINNLAESLFTAFDNPQVWRNNKLAYWERFYALWAEACVRLDE